MARISLWVSRPKSTATKAEGKLIQVGLKMILGQAVVGSQNKCLGIADHNMQPVEHTAVWVIGFMLVDVILKRRDITAVTVAADGAAVLQRHCWQTFSRTPA